jgi:hypothetical protein
MTAFNVVRFRVKAGRDQDFIDAHREIRRELPKGGRRFALLRTGEGTFCAIGEWDGFDSIVQARPMMIGMLDTMRHMLEDLGGGLGVTDPVSGEAVLDVSAAGGPRKAARKAAAGKKPMTKRKAAKKPAKKSIRTSAAKRGRR